MEGPPADRGAPRGLADPELRKERTGVLAPVVAGFSVLPSGGAGPPACRREVRILDPALTPAANVRAADGTGHRENPGVGDREITERGRVRRILREDQGWIRPRRMA